MLYFIADFNPKSERIDSVSVLKNRIELKSSKYQFEH